MAKRYMTQVEKVIADLDAKIEELTRAKNYIIASKVATTHAKPKAAKAAKAPAGEKVA